MDEAAIERMAEKIKSSGRRRRPGGRWSNPASPLQAARFEARKTGKQVVAEIRQICPGHGGEPCKIDVSKVSDYETRNRRPAVDHIEAFCRLYQKSPEELGLIKWRDDPETTTAADPGLTAEVTGVDHLAVDQVLVQLLTQTAALTATTAQLLHATLNGNGAEERPDSTIIL